MIPDIFFTKGYQDLFANTEFGGKSCHVKLAGISYRFYKRPIKGTPYFDIVSPYGYAGPIPEDADDYYGTRWDLWEKFFGEYCREQKIVAEFARLHPYLENHLSLAEENLTRVAEVFYIDLSQPFDFDKGCKSVIKKAGRTAIRTLNTFSISDFRSIYEATMRRRLSADAYFFNDDFWAKLATMPGIILGAFQAERLISAISILSHGDYAHYFLSGSDPQCRHLNGNSLLLAEGIKWAEYNGCKIFNMGGTFAGDKGLESFKRSFSRLAKPFYVYKKIHNDNVYTGLCHGKGIDPKSEGYFPAYRREGKL